MPIILAQGNVWKFYFSGGLGSDYCDVVTEWVWLPSCCCCYNHPIAIGVAMKHVLLLSLLHLNLNATWSHMTKVIIAVHYFMLNPYLSPLSYCSPYTSLFIVQLRLHFQFSYYYHLIFFFPPLLSLPMPCYWMHTIIHILECITEAQIWPA